MTEFRIAGDIIGAVGGTPWEATEDRGLMARTPGADDATFGLRLVDVPAGYYQFKVAVDGGWALSYGAQGESYPGCPNNEVELSSAGTVTFAFNATTHVTTTEVNVNGQVCDGTPKTSRAAATGFTPLRQLQPPALCVTESTPSPARTRATTTTAQDVAASPAATTPTSVATAHASAMIEKAMAEEQARVLADRLWRRASSDALDEAQNENVLAQMDENVIARQPEEGDASPVDVPAPQKSNASNCERFMSVFKSTFKICL